MEHNWSEYNQLTAMYGKDGKIIFPYSTLNQEGKPKNMDEKIESVQALVADLKWRMGIKKGESNGT